jgi:hypothetical protein
MSTPAVSAIWCPKLRQPRDADARIPGRRLLHELPGAVAAAVVDEDRLGVAVERVHDAAEVPDELLDHALLVVRRDDERVGRHTQV